MEEMTGTLKVSSEGWFTTVNVELDDGSLLYVCSAIRGQQLPTELVSRMQRLFSMDGMGVHLNIHHHTCRLFTMNGSTLLYKWTDL